MDKQDDKQHLFDKPRNVQGLLFLLFLACAILLAADFWLPKDHVHFPFETYPEFYAVYGLVACVLLVLVAKYVLRPLVIRKEDYYD